MIDNSELRSHRTRWIGSPSTPGLSNTLFRDSTTVSEYSTSIIGGDELYVENDAGLSARISSHRIKSSRLRPNGRAVFLATPSGYISTVIIHLNEIASSTPMTAAVDASTRIQVAPARSDLDKGNK